jgi:hypothetical protein
MKANEERKFRIITWCSWALYGLGASLTFAGKVFGIDELVATED